MKLVAGLYWGDNADSGVKAEDDDLICLLQPASRPGTQVHLIAP